ncbi:MAG TPA: hypothetical protein VN694_02845, partial [Caulobacteraceae bacterium]|nr:hypothetical protein [Caulobacteraceae bacterium]
ITRRFSLSLLGASLTALLLAGCADQYAHRDRRDDDRDRRDDDRDRRDAPSSGRDRDRRDPPPNDQGRQEGPSR